MRSAVWSAGLCAVLGAVPLGRGAALAAQVRPDSLGRDSTAAAAADTIPRDSASLARADSIALSAFLADTLQPPLARWRAPRAPEPVAPLVWDRNALLATGAVHLTDLLDRVPGVTSFRTSWLAGVHTAAYNGDVRRVRVFLDGVELDGPDPRTDGLLDHVDVPLLALDEVRVERTAGELRVWLRSFATESTTAFTRTDVVTGDLNTNGFRGMLGRRWRNGAALAVTAQQVESQRQRGGGIFAAPGAAGTVGDGDLTQYTVRGGWARGEWAADVQLIGTRRSRDVTEAREEAWALPAFDGSRRETMTRVAWRAGTSAGWWAQAFDARLRTQPNEPENTLGGTGGTGDDADTTASAARADSVRSRTQRAVAVGWRDARNDVALTARWRDAGNGAEFAPVLQASHDRGWAVLALHAERSGLDSARRLDATATWRARSWLRVGLAHSAWRPEAAPTFRVADTASATPGDGGDGGDAPDAVPDSISVRGPGRAAVGVTRAELALGWRDRWLTVGMIRQQSDGFERDLYAPRLLTPYDTGLSLPRFPASGSNGITAAFTGRLFKDVRLELHGTRWGDAREWRPSTQVTSQLVLESPWRSRFPKGHFGINLRLLHDYRSAMSVFVPTPGGGYDTRTTVPQNLAHLLLEIRILRAIISYQYRNVFGAAYEQVPGITMPPPHQFYGVRWEWSG